MAIQAIVLNPATGLVDSTTYPNPPVGPATGDARHQIQAVIDQIVTAVNANIKDVLNSVVDGASGADNVAMTAITETGAAGTVQAVVEALITRLKAVTDSASGADLIGMTAITETGANATVQSVIEALIARLKATTDSASGADLIGATAISGLTGGTVQALLESLKSALDGIVLGGIGDGSLTDAKLSDDAGAVKQVVAALAGVKTATITTTWTGASAPYTQDITVTGLTANDEPTISPVYSATNATAILEQVAWNNVSKIVTGTDKITVTCFQNKPVTAIPIQIKGV